MRSKICGVGINDADYVTYRRNPYWTCPYYSRWKGMISRCYNKKTQERQPTYRGCKVCEEWLTFSNFKAWMEQQDWEGRALDKDFVEFGCEIYSPTTCVFMPMRLNNFLTFKKNLDSPLGTCYHKVKGVYQVRCNDGNGNNIWCGEYSDPLEGHFVWMRMKKGIAKTLLGEYSKDTQIVKGIQRVIDTLDYHLSNKIELTSL